MLRCVESPPGRLSVLVRRAAQPVPRVRRRTGGPCARGLALGLTLGALPLATRGDTLPDAEPTPVAELGPPSGVGVQLAAAGVTIRVPGSRRSAEVTACWQLRAAAGQLQLTVPASLRPVTFALEAPGAGPLPGDSSAANRPSFALGAPAAGPLPGDALAAGRLSTGVAIEDVVPIDEALAAVPDVRIDPANAQIYASAPGAPPHGRVAHHLTVTIPASGEGILCARATLSSGFDRKYARRTNFEQAHALQNRRDPFVYQFAVRGPAGPVHIVAAADTVASARMIDGVVRAAAATRRPLPLGLTLGLGPAVSSLPPGPANGEPAAATLVQGVVRASLELLFPHRDALALALEAGSDLRGGHHGGAALVYQLYTPVWPYLPLGGHLDTGVSCDFWQSRGAGQGPASAPSLRCGPRLGATVNVAFIGLAPSVDLFPIREPIVGSADSRWTAHYRIAILGTVGL